MSWPPSCTIASRIPGSALWTCTSVTYARNWNRSGNRLSAPCGESGISLRHSGAANFGCKPSFRRFSRGRLKRGLAARIGCPTREEDMRSVYAKILLWCFATLVLSLVALGMVSRLVLVQMVGKGSFFDRINVLLLEQATGAYESGGSRALASNLNRADTVGGAEHHL